MYQLTLTSIPAATLLPDPEYPALSEAEREVVGAILFGLLRAGSTEEVIRTTLDHWFASRQAVVGCTGHSDMDPVVLIGRTTSGLVSPLPDLTGTMQKVSEVEEYIEPDETPVPETKRKCGRPRKDEVVSSMSPYAPDCSTCDFWRGRECDCSESENYGDKTDPSTRCEEYNPRKLQTKVIKM